MATESDASTVSMKTLEVPVESVVRKKKNFSSFCAASAAGRTLGLLSGGEARIKRAVPR